MSKNAKEVEARRQWNAAQRAVRGVIANRNPLRVPLAQNERQQLVAAIDEAGGVAAFSKRVGVSAAALGSVLVGNGALPATRRVLLDAILAQTRGHHAGTVSAASTEGGVG